jgi:hypothetical protein
MPRLGQIFQQNRIVAKSGFCLATSGRQRRHELGALTMRMPRRHRRPMP